MTIERWGFVCNGCKDVFGDLSDLATCETCGEDLCPACIEETGHVVIHEADDDWRREVECQ